MRPALYLAWAVFVASMVALVAQGNIWGLTLLFGEGALLSIGTLLVLRRPGNTIGTILVVMGAVWALILAADATVATLAERGNDTAVSWLALVFMMATVPLLWIGNIVIWLVFPDGKPGTTGAHKFLRISAAYTVALMVAHVFARPRIPPSTAEYPHPFLDQNVADGVAVVMDILTVLLLFLGGLVAAGMLFARSRHSDPIERRQIAWVALGYVISNVILLVNAFAQPLGDAEETEAGLSLDSIAFLVIAVTLGVAIMRYRLYDIDVIISKSVTYLGLAAVITALYATVVVGPLLLIGASEGDGPGLLLPIVATAIVALLFEPIRKRMQRWANRLVYGDRASPHEVLSQVTARLSDAPGSAGIDDLARLLAEGTGADQAVVWIRSGEMLRAEGMWSEDGLESGLPLMTEGLVVDEFTEAVSVRHEDEELGALSISKPHNDPVTPADRELLADVAAGAALVLRNMRLNNELEDRADDVRESRRRLIAAQDAERHRLERDLHDGAQQQVVALKVKLGIAKTLAQREGADEIATRVITLAHETQNAVDSLRDVAHGIYPPLLESEGLEPALRAVERSSPIAVELDIVDLERYDRSAEQTIYFFVTETLERAHISGAANAHVDVTGRNGDLVTKIDLGSLDGELDLRTVADRLDAAGGTLAIEDQPERGDASSARSPSLAWKERRHE